MQTSNEWIETLRRGFDVKRCHTHRIHGEYTVGQHTVNMLGLLLDLYAANGLEPSTGAIKAVLVHDLAEAYTGDTPTHPKRDSASLKAALDNLEDAWAKSYIPEYMQVNLTDLEKQLMKICDLLEFMYWTVEQIEMGNTTVLDQIPRVVEYLNIAGEGVLGWMSQVDRLMERLDDV
jgi:5'-deoxynucleotidase YfbR-like HD superfamily hydrolase